jgi:hypothetical protein
MGEIINLSCPACGYQSGGLLSGWGMTCELQIRLCLDCQELVSVVVQVNPHAPKTLRAQAEREFNRCPRCLGRDVEPVSPPVACPRCGAELEEILDQGGIWD